MRHYDIVTREMKQTGPRQGGLKSVAVLITLLTLNPCPLVEGNALLKPTHRGMVWARNAFNSGDYDYMGVNCGGIGVSVFMSFMYVQLILANLIWARIAYNSGDYDYWFMCEL